MYSTIFLGFFIFLTCLLLIIIILIQNPKKGIFHQSFMEKNFKLFGIKRTNTLLEKITWILSILIFFLTLLFNLLLKSNL
ncbi:MAG: preprotein translocase subunit SecG [Flavobacteriales bacterium]|jgi:preprotein translocase subunit SecG|uniref:preprotein translocase subunit SecG n=1 Tax=Blattabacterium sp. (Mastotermes darwiniensis) TaxID=39768 RepID=UPI000231DE91|nr:preprotein translocase subunit SecG [Blattabacterium sp. (Mastotermes darwiniensis)]AER40709.1 preprotein translocase subunit [Blattabacterium sp. (Mastotermes darwiniensis) str. MADAR]MDR1804763.1 preprotein translocase subunit SecG [Flavobacteriales bacterium]